MLWGKASTRSVSRRSLIEHISRIEPRALEVVVYRNTSLGYEALSGEGARVRGGRWNPPGSFPVVYAASDPGVAAAEISRTAQRYGVAIASLLPRNLTTIRVSLVRVLDLTDDSVLASVPLPRSATTDEDLRLCEAVGDAAHYLGFEAILAPSAAAPGGTTLAIFVNSLGARSAIEPIETGLLDGDSIT